MPWLAYHQQTGGHNWKRPYRFLERPWSGPFPSLSPEEADPFGERKESCDHSAVVLSSQAALQQSLHTTGLTLSSQTLSLRIQELRTIYWSLNALSYHEGCHCWAEVHAIMLWVCGAGEATQSSLLGRTNWATSNLGFFKAKAWESKLGQWCWWSPIILRLRRWGQEDQEFKVVLVFK